MCVISWFLTIVVVGVSFTLYGGGAGAIRGSFSYIIYSIFWTAPFIVVDAFVLKPYFRNHYSTALIWLLSFLVLIANKVYAMRMSLPGNFLTNSAVVLRYGVLEVVILFAVYVLFCNAQTYLLSKRRS